MKYYVIKNEPNQRPFYLTVTDTDLGLMWTQDKNLAAMFSEEFLQKNLNLLLIGILHRTTLTFTMKI